MRALLFFTMCFMMTALTNAQQIKTPEAFRVEMDSAGLIFDMPENYHAIEIPGGDVPYAFAMKHDSADFEIRYSYWPLQQEMQKYKKCKEDTSCKMRNPNTAYRDTMEPQILKLSGGKPQIIATFPPDALKKEMNCNAGGYVFYKPAMKETSNYSLIQTVVFHKDDVADLMINYLSNNREQHEVLMMEPFNALTFKPE
jgi:hypothetical protein